MESSTNRMVAFIPELDDMRETGLPEVKRFTDNKGHKLPMASSAEAYKQLAAYEKTGVTPEVVQLLKNLWFGEI